MKRRTVPNAGQSARPGLPINHTAHDWPPLTSSCGGLELSFAPPTPRWPTEDNAAASRDSAIGTHTPAQPLTITIDLNAETDYAHIVTAIHSAVQTADCARDETKNGQKGYLLHGVAASCAVLEQIGAAMERLSTVSPAPKSN